RTGMTDLVLAVDSLTTRYLRAPVLRDLSVHVGNEIVAVLGANGAGKTTLLRAISGELRPWSGSITFDGRPLTRQSAWTRARAGIAHVPEGRHVFPAMTVRENLDVAGLAGRRRNSPCSRDDVFDLFPRLRERRDQPA